MGVGTKEKKKGGKKKGRMMPQAKRQKGPKAYSDLARSERMTLQRVIQGKDMCTC